MRRKTYTGGIMLVIAIVFAIIAVLVVDTMFDPFNGEGPGR